MNIPITQTTKPVSRKLLLYFLDAVIILFTGLLASIGFALFSNTTCGMGVFLVEIGLAVFIHILTAVFFSLNNIIWRYAESREYLYLIFAELVGSVITGIIGVLFIQPPVAYLVISELCIILTVVTARFCYQVYAIHHKNFKNRDRKRLLIIGAGAAACRLLAEINTVKDCGLLPVGFIDDSEQKINRKIHGLPVLGPVKSLEEIAKKVEAEVIYLAIPSLTNEARAAILAQCLKTDCTVKSLPLLTEIADVGNLMKSIRDITPEELLGREPVTLDNAEVSDFIKGQRVIITGGGGSIGSEICRQIAAKQPARLVIVDFYENNAYDIQQELIIQYGESLDMEVYIANVCDFDRLCRIFAQEKPDMVIHAAAHKHVPLMETVPDEAVRNNVFGTWNTVMAAERCKAKKMILISSDKAVNPTNIMGATKRICEMIIQYADTVSDYTQFSAVRFGNVLSSNGSVVPLFKKQIEERSDVTVTHPDIIRYFMTIAEASQLVLTAGAMAAGGEIFVLDMGEPVKIDDLAKNMIQFAGLTLGKDINIRYIGLRPGEKLYEELLMSEEGLRQTLNKKIYIGQKIDFDHDMFVRQLEELRLLADDCTGNFAEIERKVMEIVPTFKRNPLSCVHYDVPVNGVPAL